MIILMARNATNTLLRKAKEAKSDEFYTLLPDIERELQYYGNQFRGKVVFCNCDNPYKSNFCRYFLEHFKELELKRLIVACYKRPKANLFNPDENERGFYLECTEAPSFPKLIDEQQIRYFNGNGDFRSHESISLLKSADVVVTNPPFSLFREFVALLMSYQKQFLIIGNINAITYKEIFQLIKDNKVWLGVNMGRGISGFIVPDHYDLYGTETRTNDKGQKIISPNNCLWLTNLDIQKKHEYIPLTKQYFGNETDFPKYDNYDGINVDRTQNIPKDYPGIIGVPITFLHKYNPDQFEIIRFRKGNDDKDLSINGKFPYFRILIRNRQFI